MPKVKAPHLEYYETVSRSEQQTSQLNSEVIKNDVLEQLVPVTKFNAASGFNVVSGANSLDKAAHLIQMNGNVSLLIPFTGGIICGNGNEIWLINEDFNVYKRFIIGGNVTCLASAEVGDRLLVASGTAVGEVLVHDHHLRCNDEDESKCTLASSPLSSWWCASIVSVTFLPNKDSIAAVNRYRDCYIYNIVDKTCVCEMAGMKLVQQNFMRPHLGASTFSADGCFLASVPNDNGLIHLWQIQKNEVKMMPWPSLHVENI